MTGALNKPAETTVRERFPDLEKIIGEDPARWLDRDLIDDPTARELVRSRIDALEDVNVCNVWVAAEKRLSRETRNGVLEWIDERREELAAEGRLDFGSWLEDAPKRDPEPTESVARWDREKEGGGVEVTDGRDRGPYLPSDLDYVQSVRDHLEARDGAGSDEPTPDQSVATDGGDPDGV